MFHVMGEPAMDRIVFGAAVMALAAIAVSGLGAEHTKETPAEVKKAVEDGKAVLIDVREAGEWQDGHIQNAQHLPLSEIKSGLSAEKLKTLFSTGKTVYLHCAAGSRSLKAAELLKAAGYEAKPLKPGYDELIKSGFPKAK